MFFFFFFQAEDGIRDLTVTGVQTCALPIWVAGIFLDEAGYDFTAVTRERQNTAVRIIHELGLSAFLNAYFLDHLFSLEDKLPYANGTAKNPEGLPPLLDRRDLFLLESFQVSNGTYESVSAWQARLNQAVEYRRRYGSRIFA